MGDAAGRGATYRCGMDSTASVGARSDRPALDPKFGAGRLFLADSRLAFGVLNSTRYAVLRTAFGMSREQANVATVVGALVAADVAYETARRAVRSPLGVSATDVVLTGIGLREAALGITGPASRDTRLFGTLVAGAVVAGVAMPGLRGAARRIRAGERHLRQKRLSGYIAAMRAARAKE